MTTNSSTPSGPSSAESSITDAADSRHPSTGPFMLTLCQLQGPVSIRPPQSPNLRRFTFFTTSVHQLNGGEEVSLHMGYFDTLSDAQSLLQIVRRRFPSAIANRAPFAPVAEESLTDTQVIRALETRGIAPAQSNADDRIGAQIEVLRPEDTNVRRALKEAVVQGAQVFFAVQLDWSTKRINPSRLPQLPIFKTHTLYVTESHRGDRCRYFLRLGFFRDAAEAKEVASSVRSKFASAVIAPVTEEEIQAAHKTSVDGSAFEQESSAADEDLDRSETMNPWPKLKLRFLGKRARKAPRSSATLEETLETIAARETWNDPDSASDTGVRHLRIEVLE